MFANPETAPMPQGCASRPLQLLRDRKRVCGACHLWGCTAALLVFVLSRGTLAGQEPGHENELLRQLVEQGVEFDGGFAVKLPEPILADGLDAARQREIIGAIAGLYSWQQFVRNSPVAPFELDQSYVKDAEGRRVGHVIDLCFIAHGPLDVFRDRQRAEDVFGEPWPQGGASEAEVRELEDNELSALGLQDIDRSAERYVSIGSSLMNRVYVRGVGHIRRSCTQDSIIIAWKLDPRFNRDDRLANRWYPIQTTKLGQRERGTARPYQGFGGYLKITDLAEPKGALLFEVHVVLHEPEGWFSGSNFLRSKTPLIAKEMIDKLRRKLARHDPANAAGP